MKRVMSFVFLIIMIMVMPNSISLGYGVSAVSEHKSASQTTKKNGWYINSDDGKYYYFDNDEKIVNQVKRIDGILYLFGKSGALLQDGIFTVNGSKYHTNKKGEVSCNQWVKSSYSTTENKYYYAESTGKITEYVMKKSTTYEYELYVNGIKATKNDFQHFGNNKIFGYTTHYFFKFNDDYYSLTGFNYSVYAKACCNLVEDYYKYTAYWEGHVMYDIGNHKYLGTFVGNPKTDEKARIKEGSLFNLDNSYNYIFKKSKLKTKQHIKSPLPITYCSFSLNSAGGVEPEIFVYNNSNKKIKYLYFNVYLVNGVGDRVRCSITGDSIFTIISSGPYDTKKVHKLSWYPIMYNYAATYMHISSIEIEYMDGTKKTINEKDIVILNENKRII